MWRYQGETLLPNAKVAILANDALGNVAVCTPLAQAFRRDGPAGIVDFYGGERTREIEEASVGELFSWRTSALGIPFSQAVQAGLNRSKEVGGSDLVLNIEMGPALKALAAALGPVYVCGPSLTESGRAEMPFGEDDRGDLWRDKAWVAEDLTATYPFLRSPFIGEIFFRLAYREGDLPRYKFPQEEPPFQTPPILIATGASLPEKLWPVSKWREFLQGIDGEVGLLGAPPKRQAEFYHASDSEDSLVAEGLVTDLRGKLTLPQVVGALAKARTVVTIDNGILHFAAANDVPTVGLYRPEIVRLWAPPNPNLIALTPANGAVESITVNAVREAFLSLQPPLP